MKGRLCTVDLLVLTRLDQLHFIKKILFRSFTKQATLLSRSTVLSLPLQFVFLGHDYNKKHCKKLEYEFVNKLGHF
jgi:hypothetical protein